MSSELKDGVFCLCCPSFPVGVFRGFTHRLFLPKGAHWSVEVDAKKCMLPFFSFYKPQINEKYDVNHKTRLFPKKYTNNTRFSKRTNTEQKFAWSLFLAQLSTTFIYFLVKRYWRLLLQVVQLDVGHAARARCASKWDGAHQHVSPLVEVETKGKGISIKDTNKSNTSLRTLGPWPNLFFPWCAFDFDFDWSILVVRCRAS